MSKTRIGGWPRLWLVTSLAYGLAVAAYTWETLPTISATRYEDAHLKHLSDRTLEILAGRVQASNKPATQASENAPLILEMANGAEFTVPSNTTKEQAQEVAKDYTQVVQRIVNEARIENIQKAMLIWLLPCLGVLALGLAIRWIYQGFRPSNE